MRIQKIKLTCVVEEAVENLPEQDDRHHHQVDAAQHQNPAILDPSNQCLGSGFASNQSKIHIKKTLFNAIMYICTK